MHESRIYIAKRLPDRYLWIRRLSCLSFFLSINRNEINDSTIKELYWRVCPDGLVVWALVQKVCLGLLDSIPSRKVNFSTILFIDRTKNLRASLIIKMHESSNQCLRSTRIESQLFGMTLISFYLPWLDFIEAPDNPEYFIENSELWVGLGIGSTAQLSDLSYRFCGSLTLSGVMWSRFHGTLSDAHAVEF